MCALIWREQKVGYGQRHNLVLFITLFIIYIHIDQFNNRDLKSLVIDENLFFVSLSLQQALNQKPFAPFYC